MAKKLLTPRGCTITLRYDTHEAQLTITSEGVTTVYDEDECDRLLRVIECAAYPVEDLSEFFESEFRHTHFRVAVQFYDHAQALAELVYD